MRSIIMLVLVLVALATHAVAGTHYPAHHCELFVDRVVAYQGNHALRAIKFYVKTLNDRLDGPIVEVGFRHRRTGRFYGASVDNGWVNTGLDRFANSTDYWVLNLQVSSNYGQASYEGVFFARTVKDTYYWLHPAKAENFVFDRRTHDDILNVMGLYYNYNTGPQAGVSTVQDGLRYFNPGGCH
jgi:hypothetical protein